MPRPAAALLALLLVTACATAGQRSDSQRTGHGLTLCVANESEGVGTIRVWVETFRALTVSSGSRECRPIMELSSGTRLYAQSMGGGMRGPVEYQGVITSSADIRCWDWVLRDSSTSQIHLVPCEFHERRR